jgi:hypothetical protein
MLHEFTLVLKLAEITDDQCNRLYATGLDDGTISTSGGVSRIDVAREADSLETAIRTAIGNVNAAGLTVASVEIEAAQFAPESAS